MIKRGVILCIILLLLTGLTISPAIGSIIEAVGQEHKTVYFWDLTGKKPVKKVIEFTDYEWNNLRNQIKEIRTTSSSIEESFNAQFALIKQYDLISYDMTYETLKDKAMNAFKSTHYKTPITPIPDNVIINAICAINFELTSGKTFVFGLNTFMNIVGFNIISFHKGITDNGIETTGLLQQSTDPGEYVGFMFGLLGYWFGTKTGVGWYSDLTVAGFTVFTSWVPLGS